MRGNMVLPTPLQAFSGMPKAAATTEKQTIVDGEKMTGAEALVRSLEDLASRMFSAFQAARFCRYTMQSTMKPASVLC